MDNIRHDPKCINKTCIGGMLMRNPARPVPCSFCNPAYRPERTKPYTVETIKHIAIDFHNAHTYEEVTYTNAWEIWWANNRHHYIKDNF